MLPSRKKKETRGRYHYNEGKNVTTDHTGIKRLIREHFEDLDNKFDILAGMDNVLEIQNLPKQIREQIENLNSSIPIK